MTELHFYQITSATQLLLDEANFLLNLDFLKAIALN